MGKIVTIILLVGAVYVGLFYLFCYEVKHFKAMIAKQNKQTELYECLLKKLQEDC